MSATPCPNCGRLVDQSTRFCAYCGAEATAASHASEYNEPPMATRPLAQPSQLRSERGIFIGLSAAAALIVVLIGVALYVGGVFGSSNPAPAANQTPAVSSPNSASGAAPSAAGTTPAFTATTATSSAATTTTTSTATTTSNAATVATGLIGAWHGVITQYAPSGTRQRIRVSSQISAEGDHLVGQNSETTIEGSGVGTRCEGRMRQTALGTSTATFAYDETFNLASCIAHTVITFTSIGAGKLSYDETYRTNIGPGQLVGQLVG